jgi:hypothetical protein
MMMKVVISGFNNEESQANCPQDLKSDPATHTQKRESLNRGIAMHRT